MRLDERIGAMTERVARKLSRRTRVQGQDRRHYRHGALAVGATPARPHRTRPDQAVPVARSRDVRQHHLPGSFTSNCLTARLPLRVAFRQLDAQPRWRATARSVTTASALEAAGTGTCLKRASACHCASPADVRAGSSAAARLAHPCHSDRVAGGAGSLAVLLAGGNGFAKAYSPEGELAASWPVSSVGRHAFKVGRLTAAAIPAVLPWGCSASAPAR
jgi:hypothetical protein